MVRDVQQYIDAEAAQEPDGFIDVAPDFEIVNAPPRPDTMGFTTSNFSKTPQARETFLRKRLNKRIQQNQKMQEHIVTVMRDAKASDEAAYRLAINTIEDNTFKKLVTRLCSREGRDQLFTPTGAVAANFRKERAALRTLSNLLTALAKHVMVADDADDIEMKRVLSTFGDESKDASEDESKVSQIED